jgi:NhaP-type Na+/H+ and K+/H+ antiporter
MDQTTLATDTYYMTREFLHKQVAALAESIEKKDALIISLQDRSSEHSQKLYSQQRAHQATKDAVKEYVLESLKSGDMSHEIAEALGEICDFELTKTVTVNAIVEFEVEIEVPFDVDADDVANTLEFSVDSFDYSIDDYNVDTRTLNAEDSIS